MTTLSFLLVVLVVFIIAMSSRRAGASIVRETQGAHPQVGHAAARLESYLGTLSALPDKAMVTVTISAGAAAAAGEEGFTIRSVAPMCIEISANTDAGAANGLYRLMMAARTRQMADPFAEQWDLTESPRWADRRVSAASYVMGMTKMTPDTWTFPDWKEYIDFIRQFNVNRLTILGAHLWHPDEPETYKHRWRLDAYRQAIAYAHENGMKVNVMVGYNMVPPALFWRHPEWQTDSVPGYFGQALCWSKAKKTILECMAHNIDYLKGLDGIELMVTEPLGWCLCDECLSDVAAIYVDAIKEFGALLRKNNPDGEVVFWNWILGYLPGTKGVYPPTDKIDAEALAAIQPAVLRDMPMDTIFIDLSRHQMRNPPWTTAATAPGTIEILQEAPEKGFRTRNYMFYMDVEFGMLDHVSLFPKPFLDLTIDEFEYTKPLPVEGVCSYRLAPPGRFLSDFFFLRKAWSPELGREELVSEAAGFLTTSADDARLVAGAIESIEQYWHKRERADLVAARDAFEIAAEGSSGWDFERTRTGLIMLALVDEYARLVKSGEEALRTGQSVAELTQKAEAKLLEVYAEGKKHAIYQGLTSDGLWEPRALQMLLRPRMAKWADYINNKHYYE